MILKQNFLKISAFILTASALVMVSCKEEVQRLTIQDTADITEEALTDTYFQDMDDMAGIAIQAPSDNEYSSGRTSGSITIEDDRFNCEGIVVSLDVDPASTPNAPKGVLSVDFGTSGCGDLRGNTRKGKVSFNYHGRRFMPGSTVVTTTENYFINGIKLEGTRTLTNRQNSNSSAPRFNVVLANGKATFPNALFATRQSDITWQWHREANPVDDHIAIDRISTASGITRGGRTYEVSLLEDLVYKRSCGIAVSGVKKYVIDGTKEVTIDYGDGTCDKTFSVTVDGVVRNITL
jgi:hypothetical protein